MERTKHMSDPWRKFHIDENFPDEVATRHRYNARKKTWVQDNVHVRMEKEVQICSIIITIAFVTCSCHSLTKEHVKYIP